MHGLSRYRYPCIVAHLSLWMVMPQAPPPHPTHSPTHTPTPSFRAVLAMNSETACALRTSRHCRAVDPTQQPAGHYPAWHVGCPTRHSIPYGVVSIPGVVSRKAWYHCAQQPRPPRCANRRCTGSAIARPRLACAVGRFLLLGGHRSSELAAVRSSLLAPRRRAVHRVHPPPLHPSHTHAHPSIASPRLPSLPFPPSSYTRSLAFSLLSPTPTRRSLPLRAHRAAHVGAARCGAARAGRYNKNMAKVRQHRSVARRHKDKGANSSGGTCRTSNP